VLHVGDSMVGGRGGLTKALGARFRELGASVRSDSWDRVGIERYARDQRLGTLVRETEPDLVIVTLGTNDVFVPHPEALAAHVKSIVRTIGATPLTGDGGRRRACYWLGPPTWKGDTGIVQVIRESCAPCVFFDSSHLTLERVHDGIHLTDAGGEAWAQAFWAFFTGR
jgi:acyl-CoA thioesterase-1